jgi:hypothetical protein
MQQLPSILVCYGLEHYSNLAATINECRDQGISRKIPTTAIPQGMVSGMSKIFCAHPKAIMRVTKEGKSLSDVAYALFELEAMSEAAYIKWTSLTEPFWTGAELKSSDFVPDNMLDLTYSFALLTDAEQKELVKEYGIEWCQGIFGYGIYDRVEFVLDDGETGLPDEYKHLEGLVTPVHVVYKDDSNDEDVEDEL